MIGSAYAQLQTLVRSLAKERDEARAQETLCQNMLRDARTQLAVTHRQWFECRMELSRKIELLEAECRRTTSDITSDRTMKCICDLTIANMDLQAENARLRLGRA